MLSLLLFALACSTTPTDSANPGDTGGADPDAPPGQTMKGSAPRSTSPSTANLPALQAANADFAVRLLQELGTGDNQLTSPWSLQVVMAQVAAGADGDTKTAILDTFGWTIAEPDLHEAFNAAGLAVEAHDRAESTEEEPALALTSTNQIFVDVEYTDLGVPWLDTLSTHYGTGVQVMDFAADPAGVASDINAWIAARTGDHIKTLITEPMVVSSEMMLVNALYFNASWAVPFSESQTSDQAWTLLDGATVTAEAISGPIPVLGAAGDGFFVADLPFSDEGLTLTVVLPDAGRYAEVSAALDWATIQAVIDAEELCDPCEVQLPKFEMESKPDMHGALSALGMDRAFGGSYSGIHPDLTLTDVQQMGFVALNEKGVEAAAATVATFDDSATEPPFGPVIVGRPFLWFIRETDGSVLFAGAVVDPR